MWKRTNKYTHVYKMSKMQTMSKRLKMPIRKCQHQSQLSLCTRLTSQPTHPFMGGTYSRTTPLPTPNCQPTPHCKNLRTPPPKYAPHGCGAPTPNHPNKHQLLSTRFGARNTSPCMQNTLHHRPAATAHEKPRSPTPRCHPFPSPMLAARQNPKK